MNDEVKLWLEILTSGKVAIEADQARCILWLSIWHAVQARVDERLAPVVVPAVVPVPKPAKPTRPGLAKTKPAKATKPVVAQVLAAIKAGATSYEALRAACPKVDPKRIYRACDQLVQRNQIARTRTKTGVTLAAR